MASQISKEDILSIDAPKKAESEGNPELAARLYEDIIKKEPLNEFAYNRLMILYRKQRELKKEMVVINKGLKAYEQFYASKHKHSKNSKIAQLSNELLRKTGLVDKKGNFAFEPEPIAKWKKRKTLVEKKLEAVKK